MTYETKIRIEIAGIRRSLRIAFDFHMGTVDGERQPIHDSVRVLTRDRLPGTWIYHAIGVRQLKALDGRLIAHWASRRGRSGIRRKRARAN
jgi:hypothetical protein